MIISGCGDDSTSNSYEYNNVSIRSVNDTLAISISTTNHNYNQTIPVVFSVDTLKLSMLVSGYGSGNGLFKIMNDTTALFTKDLNSNFSISQQLTLGTLIDAVLTLQSYKGNANILLTR
jgi:hypothetical protein